MRRVFVDSSAWIEFGRGTGSPAAFALRRLVEARDPFKPADEDDDEAAEIILGDLVLAEVLRGLADEREYRAARDWLLSFEVVRLGGTATALAAVDHYRALRRLGITIRNQEDHRLPGRGLVHRARRAAAAQRPGLPAVRRAPAARGGLTGPADRPPP